MQEGQCGQYGLGYCFKRINADFIITDHSLRQGLSTYKLGHEPSVLASVHHHITSVHKLKKNMMMQLLGNLHFYHSSTIIYLITIEF